MSKVPEQGYGPSGSAGSNSGNVTKFHAKKKEKVGLPDSQGAAGLAGDGKQQASGKGRTVCHKCGHYADQLGYDPQEFIIPAADENGHSEKIWVKLPPQYANEIAAIVHSDLFGWDTPNGVARWCIHHGLKFLFSLHPEHPHHFSVIQSINRTRQKYELHVAMVESMNAIEQQVRALTEINAREEAVRLVAEVRNDVMRLEEGFWKDRHMAELERRFGHLKNSKPASLVPVPAPPDELADELSEVGVVTDYSDYEIQ